MICGTPTYVQKMLTIHNLESIYRFGKHKYEFNKNSSSGSGTAYIDFIYLTVYYGLLQKNFL